MVKAFDQTTNGPVNALLISGSTVSTKTSFAKFDIVLKSIRVISVVTGNFGPRSFRTQVTSYHFRNFVPTFWSHFVSSHNHFVPRSFRTHFGHFVPSTTGYEMIFESHFVPKSFRTYFGHFVPVKVMVLVKASF